MIAALLKAWWRPLALAALVGGAGFAAGLVYMTADMASQQLAAEKAQGQLRSELDAEKLARTGDRLAAERRYSDGMGNALEIQKGWMEKADRLSLQLIADQNRLKQLQLKLEEQRNAAVKKDGDRYTGIGPDSLRLYRTALGYPAAAGHAGYHGVPETSGDAAGNPANASGTGGLDPAGLLRGAESYGAWCMGLRSQLEQINHYFREKE